MKKRGFLILFVFLIIIKTSFSLSQDLVFSDTVYNKDVKDIEGKEFKFRVIKDLVSVDIDVTGVIIGGGGCKIKDNFNICISNISFAYRNSTTWENIYKALVKIYTIKSDLTLTKNIAKTELLVNEEVEVVLSLENTADRPAENVILTESYPNEFFISNMEGCSLNFNKITFQGQVSPRQIRTCTYKVKGIKPVTYTSVVEASYFDGSEIKILEDSQIIKVLNYSLKAEITKDKDDIAVGDDFGLSLTLRNINEDEDLIVTSFVLEVPSGFTIKKTLKGMQKKNNLLLWNGKIEKESEINFTGNLTAIRSGKQVFNTDASYKIAGFLRDFIKSYEINVDCDCPFIDYKVGKVVPGLKTDFIVSIKNPGIISFRNLKIDYTTNIPNIKNFSTAFGSILEGSTIGLIKERITSPAEGERYYFNINIAYESSFNEFFVEKEKIIIPLTLLGVGEEVVGESEETLNETGTEEEIEVGTPEIEQNITQEIEEKEEVPKKGKEFIVLLEERAKVPFEALSIIGVIILFISIFVLFRVLKGEREKEKKVAKK